jgi:hypothetical protein
VLLGIYAHGFVLPPNSYTGCGVNVSFCRPLTRSEFNKVRSPGRRGDRSQRDRGLTEAGAV